jgi:predicted dinucleotide-binding enzyme
MGAAHGALDGKVLVDATNPVGPGIRLATGPDGASQAERTQQLVPRARVVKAFNQTGANNVAGPSYDPRPVMFVAGDDADARRTAATLTTDLGFEPIEAGPLVRARELESLAILWIALSASPTTGLGREFVFTLARR